MQPLLVLGHLGLGDCLACNGLVRYLAADRPLVLVVCKRVSSVSVAFMYRDLSKVQLLVVGDDSDISPAFGASSAVLASFLAAGFETLLLGRHRGPLPGGAGFVDAHYDQAGVPREARYTHFRVDRNELLEWRFRPAAAVYSFVHDDPDRGIAVLLPPGAPRPFHPGRADVRPGSDNVFAFVGMMEGALEIHCCDSSFAWLADLLDLRPGRRTLHCYARNPQDACEELFRRPGWAFLRR